MENLKLYIDDENQMGRRSGQSPTVSLLPDPALIWQIFRRNFFLFWLACAACIGLAAVYLHFQIPIYSTSASILIEPTSDVIRTNEPGVRNSIVNADEVDTEIRLINSPLVTMRAATLYASQYPSPDGDPFTEDEITVLSSQMGGSLLIARSGQTRIVDIIGIGPDPEFITVTSNLVAQAYLNSQVEAKTTQNDSSAAFINERLKGLQRNAQQKQIALDSYKAASGLISDNGAQNAALQVSNLTQQLNTSMADLAEKTARYNTAAQQLSSGGTGESIGATLGSGTIGALRQRESGLKSQLAVLRERYGALHPERRAAEEELLNLQSSIQDEINRILANLKTEEQTANARVQSLQASLNVSRQASMVSLEKNSQAQAGLGLYEQEANAAQAIFQSFLERSQETGALRDSAMPDGIITAQAQLPLYPIAPRSKIIMVFGTILGFCAGVFAICVAEYLRRGIQTKRDVERRLRLRYAGAIPTLKSTVRWKRIKDTPGDYVINNPQSIFAESFRSIQTFLTLSPGKRPRAIAVTSALPSEGKTTTAVCLALTTALAGNNVLLVDADLRRRGASSFIKYSSEKDIFDYMWGKAKLSDCIYVDPRTNLKVLGTNKASLGHQNPITEERVKKMLAELRKHFDIIIVDTAPILGVADGRVIATAVDRVLLVTRWKKTSMRAVEAVSSMLINAGAKVTGLALTRVNIKKYASTGDGDIYAYTKKFRGYYQN